jgi:hypothetical protein
MRRNPFLPRIRRSGFDVQFRLVRGDQRLVLLYGAAALELARDQPAD